MNRLLLHAIDDAFSFLGEHRRARRRYRERIQVASISRFLRLELSLPIAEPSALRVARKRLPIALLGNAIMRIAGGASGILVGLYLADLANRGSRVNAA